MPDVRLNWPSVFAWAGFPARANISGSGSLSPWHWLRGPRLFAGSVRVESAPAAMRVALIDAETMGTVATTVSGANGNWQMPYGWRSAPHLMLVLLTPQNDTRRATVFNI